METAEGFSSGASDSDDGVQSLLEALDFTRSACAGSPPPTLTKLASDLARLNPHFPVDEAELLPERIFKEAEPGHRFSSASSTIQVITCRWHCANQLAVFCQKVPVVLRTLTKVVLEWSAESHNLEYVVEHLTLIFGKAAPTHTLVLKIAETAFVAAVVKAQLPALSRLILEDISSLDLDVILPLLAENKILEEVSFESSGLLSSKTLNSVKKCDHINFTVVDERRPPPRRAAQLPQSKELQQALPLAEFNKLCKEEKANPPIGLLTAYGQVVPLAKELVPRFQLLQDMLKENDGAENLVPMELDPPVGKESVALAVHFVTHCVSEEVEKECEDAGKKWSWNGTVPEDRPSYTWCPAFEVFHATHIQQRYATSQRRMQVMCELMALAAYLNCPSLKRFLRAALVMEDNEDTTCSERGKRNR